MPQSTNIMHWSSEARRQAAASALEAKRVASQRDAGSAKVSLLPPKVCSSACPYVRHEKTRSMTRIVKF